MNETEIIEGLKDSVINFDEDKSRDLANKALEIGMDPQDAIFDGLAAGMEVVGKYFSEGEYFVPEVLMSADALNAGLEILKPHVKVDDKKRIKGAVVLGTVEGDVHDIGKNIVKLMFEIAGFTVYDLGKDVPLDKFVDEQLKTDSDIVALSAMMTTTMTGMKKVIEKIREKNPKVKIMIGGAPVTEETAKAYGADATAKDASNALSEAINMVASLREEMK